MRSEDSRLRTVLNADGMAILDTVGGQITTLNATGAMVWQGLERGEDLDTIAAAIVRETGAEIGAAKTDIRDLIDKLADKKLLPRRGGE